MEEFLCLPDKAWLVCDPGNDMPTLAFRLARKVPSAAMFNLIRGYQARHSLPQRLAPMVPRRDRAPMA